MKRLAGKFTTSSAVLILCLIVYSLLIIGFNHYERLTGDTTIYLSIAEKYLRGDFSNAINGYWGPLLSWLLVPLLALGSTHVFAINALNMLFGILTMIGIWRLSFKLDIHETVRTLIVLAIVPVLFFVSLVQPMDFLLLSVLVFYLNTIFSKNYTEKLSPALVSGALGALAYFSKPYGFPFFISHFLLMNACYYFSNNASVHRKRVLKNCLAGFMIFFLLSGAWIGLISSKYGHFTFSNMGKGVFRGLGPGSVHSTLEKGDPIFFDGFFEPPNETALIIYEDPTYARKKAWNPLDSKKTFEHFIGNLSENVVEGVRIYESFSRFSLSIVVACLLLICIRPPHTILAHGSLIYPFLTSLLYTGGYMLFHYETRYLWIINILLLLMGGNVLTELYNSQLLKKKAIKNILSVLFLISFIATPVKASLQIGQNNINKEMYILGSELKRRYNIQGDIASNRKKLHSVMHDSWHYTFRLAYWLNSRYFGMPQKNISDEELLAELTRYNIDFYFYWGNLDNAPDFLLRHKELTNGEIPDLHIFSLKEHK